MKDDVTGPSYPIPQENKPDQEFLMQFFEFAHLPLRLQGISQRFAEVAAFITTDLPRNPERSTALRKLLESKDCAVRAALAK